MTIDKSGRWWVGSEANDIREYLRAYKAEGYEVHETRICRCDCESIEFQLEADGYEGCARRTCAGCGATQFVCDSAVHWEEVKPETWKCTECGSKMCNLGVGFSLYEVEPGETSGVRWVSVGERCTNCGMLGSFVDWKVGYGPAEGLLERA